MTASSAPPVSPAQRLAAVEAGVPEPLRTLGRGVGQIFLQPSAITGLLIVIGIAVYSPLMAVEVIIGTVVATASALYLGREVPLGLEGYNAALVGAASWLSIGRFWPATLATLVGAAACPAVLRLIGKALSRTGLSPLTAPFCVTSGLIAMLLGSVAPALSSGGSATVHGSAIVLALKAVFTGVSEVVLAESWIGGILILIGLFVAGWRAGLSALMGSVIGTLLTAATTSWTDAVHGLGGYSPCLTALALAAVLLPHSGRSWVIAAVGAALTVLVGWVFTALIPVPTYTWPFIVTTWIVLLVEPHLPGHVDEAV